MQSLANLVTTAVFCALFILRTDAEIVGQIELDGQTLYVWRLFGSVTVQDGAITIAGDTRAYLLETPTLVIEPDDYYQTILSGRTLSYTADLSHVPCHCNAAVFFNKMPAYEAGDLLDYYCDANYVGGIGCPEFDGIESNKHTVFSNLHNCAWDGEWWLDCDTGGCGTNAWDVDSEAFGQGKMIDSNLPLTISHYQSAEQATIQLDQDGNTLSFSVCNDPDYVSSMDLHWQDGMVYVFALWGSADNNDMGWLDDATGCEPEGGVVGCDITNSYVTYSNFQLI